MKRIIGFSLVIVLYMLFGGIVYGIDENKPSTNFVASELMFPSNIARWDYKMSDESLVSVWLGGNQVLGKESYQTICETKVVLGGEGSPFAGIRLDKDGNLKSYAKETNEVIKSAWLQSMKQNFFPEDFAAMEKSFKFSSDEWLLLPATVSYGSKWEVVSFKCAGGGWKLGDKIFGELFNSQGFTYTYLDKTYQGCGLGFYRETHNEIKTGKEYLFIFTCVPNLGIVYFTYDDIRAELVSLTKSVGVDVGKKATTSWGKIKTQ